MLDIFELILTVIIIFYSYKFLSWFIKRTIFIFNIYSLKKLCNATITLQTFPYRPMWAVSEGEDIRIEIGNTVYLVRIYSGGGGMSSVHFANKNYSCVYLRLRAANRAPQGTGANSLAMSGGVNISSKVICLPDFPVPEGESGDKRLVRVLLLNPAPSVLSYVTDEKTSIRIAFTGDEMYGIKVFTPDAFLRFAERMKREEERLADENYKELDYYSR